MNISKVCMEPNCRYIFVTCNLTHPVTTETITSVGNRFDNGTDDIILNYINKHTVIIKFDYSLQQSLYNIVFDNLRFVDREPVERSPTNVVDKLYSKAFNVISNIREWYD